MAFLCCYYLEPDWIICHSDCPILTKAFCFISFYDAVINADAAGNKQCYLRRVFLPNFDQNAEHQDAAWKQKVDAILFEYLH
jgi:hypothetical protein